MIRGIRIFVIFYISALMVSCANQNAWTLIDSSFYDNGSPNHEQ